MPEEKAISNEECEKFIKLVREHPCIYDVTSTEYNDAQKLRNVWEKVARTMGRRYISGKYWNMHTLIYQEIICLFTYIVDVVVSITVGDFLLSDMLMRIYLTIVRLVRAFIILICTTVWYTHVRYDKLNTYALSQKYCWNCSECKSNSMTRLWYAPCSFLLFKISWTHHRCLLFAFFLFCKTRYVPRITNSSSSCIWRCLTLRALSPISCMFYTGMRERRRIYGYKHIQNRMSQTQSYLHAVYAYVQMDS